MAYTDIDKPSDYFNTKLTTGTGSTQAVTGLGFQPDFLWGKRRDSTGNNTIFDVVRGITKGLETNSTGAEFTSTDYYDSFDSDGFTIASGSSGCGNGSGQTAVQWGWKANGAGVSNTDGSITSSVSANQDAGFSIVSWSGTGSNGTIGHGLGAVPQVVLIKERNGTNNWVMSHQPLSASLGDYTRFMTLNSDGAVSGAGNVVFQGSAFTSSYFNVGTSVASNRSGGTYIGYVFAEKTGFSKFSLYTGNGNADGTFVYTGFKPAFVMVKKTSGAGSSNWVIADTARSDVPNANVNDQVLYPNLNNSEESSSGLSVDLVSNGFKIRGTGGDRNTSGAPYIYMAFAENPFVTSTGIPTTAR
jgi:hypothetical protein